MKFWLSLLFLFTGIVCVNGQSVSGKVVDDSQRPVEFANVVLLSLPDSAFVQGTVSGADGTFSLPAATVERGLLRVSCIGYATLYKPLDGTDAGTLQLAGDAQMLGEVVVKGNVMRKELRNGGILTNVAGSVLEKAGTAEDLLDHIPGVAAGEGTVSVFGRGTAEVYINGRKVRDGSELDQLASDRIKSVEVINNPGARYAATVKAVVRIITKRAQGEGFGFNNRAYAKYNKEWTWFDQFNWNYRKNGFDLSGMLSGRDSRGWNKKGIVQDTYLEKRWNQSSFMDEKEHSRNLYAMLSGNYTFGCNHALGVRYNFMRMPKYDSRGTLKSRVMLDDVPEEQLESTFDGGMRRTRHTLNAYYAGTAGKWSIDFNADALWDKSTSNDRTDEVALDNHGMESGKRKVSSRSRAENSLLAAKLIFSREWLGGELSVGGEYSHNNHLNRYENYEGLLEDAHSEIREGSAAAFVEYGRTFGKVMWQAGLRFEYMSSGYYDNGRRVAGQSKHYNDWFPSLSVMWPVGKVQMALSYSSDLLRPSYHELRGNIVYNNRYTYESGNPLLKPQVTHNLVMNAVYDWVQLNVGYNHVKDAIVSSSRPYSAEEPMVALLAPVNTSAYDRMFAALSLAPTIGIWFPRFTGGVEKQWYEADTPWGRKSLNTPVVSLSWENSQQLPGGFLLDAGASWSSCGYRENMQMKRALWSVDLMLFKGFMKNRLTFQLEAEDLFDSTRMRALTYLGAVHTFYSDAYPNSRSVSLTVRYKFNAAKNKYKGTGAGASQKSRM